MLVDRQMQSEFTVTRITQVDFQVDRRHLQILHQEIF